MKKVIIILIILAVIAGGYFAFRAYQGQARQRAISDLQTVAVERGELTASVGATGTVRSNQTATLTWQTTGNVESVEVKAGDLVEAGQLLASLKESSLSQAIILARSDLVNAQKSLDELRNSKLPQAQAFKALEDAQLAYDEREDNLKTTQAQAILALVTATDAYDDAKRSRDYLNYARASQTTIAAAEAEYVLAQNAVDKAQKAFNKVSGRRENDPGRAMAQTSLSAAIQNRDAALRKLNWLKGKPSELEIQEADAKLAQAEAQMVAAQNEWERVKEGLSAADVALLEARLADAKREYERIKNGPDPNDVAALEARIAAAEATLSLIRLEAPFSGTITDVQTKPGDQANPGQYAFRLDDLAHLLVDVSVSEVDINRIQVGQPVVLTFDAILNKEYQGTIIDVGQVGTVAQGVVEFPVTVELTNPDKDVKPGMTAAVNVVVDKLEDVVLVPNRAVRLLDGKRVVYVLDGGTLEPREIVLGASSETMSEVRDGSLQVGEAVVLNPPVVFEQNGPPSFIQR